MMAMTAQCRSRLRPIAAFVAWEMAGQVHGGLPLVEKFAKVGKMDRKYRHNDRIGCMIVMGKRLGRWG
jgi:hypothetical protein